MMACGGTRCGQSCQLTVLGEHYRELVEKKLL